MLKRVLKYFFEAEKIALWGTVRWLVAKNDEKLLLA
jgi:hypothetical protein